jgi:hypothetical protein
MPILWTSPANRLRNRPEELAPKTDRSGRAPLAFTVAPHLQIINYRGCFSPFVGI